MNTAMMSIKLKLTRQEVVNGFLFENFLRYNSLLPLVLDVFSIYWEDQPLKFFLALFSVQHYHPDCFF